MIFFTNKKGGINTTQRDPKLYQILIFSCACIIIVGFLGGMLLGYNIQYIGLGVLCSSIASALFIVYDFLIIKGGTRWEREFSDEIADKVEKRVKNIIKDELQNKTK